MITVQNLNTNAETYAQDICSPCKRRDDNVLYQHTEHVTKKHGRSDRSTDKTVKCVQVERHFSEHLLNCGGILKAIITNRFRS